MAKSRRRRHYEEPEQHERWMVSYADFITLLFAFFVVMYSISSVNEGKYKVLSNSLGDAFKPVLEQALAAKQSATPADSSASLSNQSLAAEMPSALEDKTTALTKKLWSLSDIAKQFADVLQPYIEQRLLVVTKRDAWVELEINSEFLFLNDAVDVSSQAQPALKKIAEVIRELPNKIKIEEYSATVPETTAHFPENWDLAFTRATTVLRQLVHAHVNPKRLTAVGYGEAHQEAVSDAGSKPSMTRHVLLLILANNDSDDQQHDRGQSGAAPVQAVSSETGN